MSFDMTDHSTTPEIDGKIVEFERLMRLGYLRQADAFFDANLKEHEDRFPVFANYADLLFLRGKHEETIEWANETLQNINHSLSSKMMLVLVKNVAKVYSRGSASLSAASVLAGLVKRCADQPEDAPPKLFEILILRLFFRIDQKFSLQEIIRSARPASMLNDPLPYDQHDLVRGMHKWLQGTHQAHVMMLPEAIAYAGAKKVIDRAPLARYVLEFIANSPETATVVSPQHKLVAACTFFENVPPSWPGDYDAEIDLCRQLKIQMLLLDSVVRAHVIGYPGSGLEARYHTVMSDYHVSQA